MCLSIHWMHTSLRHKTMRHFTRFHLVGFALLSAMFITSCDPNTTITESDIELFNTPSLVYQSGNEITITLSNTPNPKVNSTTFNSLSNKLHKDWQAKAYLQEMTNWLYN